MAKGTRSKGANIFVWILMAGLLVGLAGFGLGSLGGGSVRSIGKVGDEPVLIDDYARALNNQLRNLSQQTGQNITLSQAKLFGVDRQVLSEVLTTATLNGEARRIGLSVGDQTVKNELLATPAFRGLDGAFDKAAYEYALEQAGLKPGEYENLIRKDKARALLQRAIVGGVDAGETQAKIMLAHVREGRNFQWTMIDENRLDVPTAEPTEADIAAYFEANPDDFTAPLTRQITYVHLSPAMLISTIEEDEAALREVYDSRSDLFNRPETRLMERLVFASLEEAQTARDAIDAGSQSFETLAEARGFELDDIDMGEVAREDLASDAAQATFDLEEPGIVGPVQSSLGPALFRINAILEALSTPFEDARAELQAEYAADAARRLVANSVTDIDDLMAAGASLEEVAAETDMILGTMDFTISSEEGLAAYDAFRAEAAAVSEGDFAEVRDLSDGGIFALRLDGIIEAALRPLDDVREDVISGWRKAETERRLGELAATIKAQLDGGETFETLGLNITQETEMTRDGFIDIAPPTLITQVFTLAENEVTVVAGDGSVAVARLQSVVPFDLALEENATLVATVRARIGLQVTQDIFEAYTVALQEDAGITIDQSAINAVHQQFP